MYFNTWKRIECYLWEQKGWKIKVKENTHKEKEDHTEWEKGQKLMEIDEQSW